jgi:hypothetical protein
LEVGTQEREKPVIEVAWGWWNKFLYYVERS